VLLLFFPFFIIIFLIFLKKMFYGLSFDGSCATIKNINQPIVAIFKNRRDCELNAARFKNSYPAKHFNDDLNSTARAEPLEFSPFVGPVMDSTIEAMADTPLSQWRPMGPEFLHPM
jgi:hypothetical protein